MMTLTQAAFFFFFSIKQSVHHFLCRPGICKDVFCEPAVPGTVRFKSVLTKLAGQSSCPIIDAVLYVGDPYDPVPTQADSAKTWWTQIDPTVVCKEVGSFYMDAHRALTIYHFSSSNIEEQLTVFIIHNDETVAVNVERRSESRFSAVSGSAEASGCEHPISQLGGRRRPIWLPGTKRFQLT